ncbi:hypothetical protein CTAYLR_006661 [Chrysophaeum taylorii]|uniref:tRNA:m(4)X modification enzyme TRM13 n=1 Tax=Chrysophaeum taylorii TaxID=2483200 RepID=A0AAD7UDF5_9STRA|nr:hypothetical protein CTAYLR_006661 [Chrysophaeum taylorii]
MDRAKRRAAKRALAAARRADAGAAPPSGVCGVWLERKQRWCSLPAEPGCALCRTHDGAERVACPVDGSHTVARSKLEAHVKICNATKIEAARATQPWFAAGANGGGAGDLGDRGSDDAGASVDEVAAAVADVDISGDVVVLEAAVPTRAARHEVQARAIVAALGNELEDDVAFVDLGGGRAGLASAARAASPAAPIAVIEREKPRFKFDGQLRRDGDFERVHCDLRDVRLDGINVLSGCRSIVGLAKHLCGNATDLALKALVANPGVAAIAIATCCHHRCDWGDYVGRDHFPKHPRYFHAVAKLSSWASVPHAKPPQEEGEEESASTAAAAEALRAKRLLGRRCKRVIDRGRLEYLRRNGFPSATEWRETEAEDERFLPTIEAEASEIVEGLFLGSEANAMDVVWLKVTGISKILTINSYPVRPATNPHLSESLKGWFKENVEHSYLEALDSPTQLILEHFQPALDFIGAALDAKKRVLVHCGRGISRSATLVIAALMDRDRLSYTQAFALVSAKRPSIYPNVGFQIQLCLFEREKFDAARRGVDLAREIAISIDRVLANVEELMDAMFDDERPRDEPERWMDFGFFVQNCREYLGHVDIGLPLETLAKAQDVARRLQNLEIVFEGAGVATAARVGRVLDVWQTLQHRMSASPGALPRVDLASYVSVLKDGDEPTDASRREDSDTVDPPEAKRRREK